jgi:hypothetical protein
MNKPLEVTYYANPIIKGVFIIQVGEVNMWVYCSDFDSEDEAEQFCQLIVNNLTK